MRYWEQKAYFMYVADGMYLQGQGKAYGKRYSDIITPQVVDDRSGDEIAADIIRRMELQFQ